MMNQRALNLSNHPSDRWGDAQSAAAKELFGKVDDVQFPAVPEGASTKEVIDMAKQALHNIITLGYKQVHITGEPCFVMAFVAAAQKRGVKCWHSTSKRVSEEKDGKKISTFIFEQFRAYPELRELI